MKNSFGFLLVFDSWNCFYVHTCHLKEIYLSMIGCMKAFIKYYNGYKYLYRDILYNTVPSPTFVYHAALLVAEVGNLQVACMVNGFRGAS